MLGIYDDSFLDEYKRLTEMVHTNGSKIISQIVYGGSNTAYNIGKRPILSPSGVIEKTRGTRSREMSQDDIRRVKDMFRRAALRAKRAASTAFRSTAPTDTF
jgi:2,4-dienoyl-CoA reductase-like NADH-dependent reductase (Old Yellow Enzyme family)